MSGTNTSQQPYLTDQQKALAKDTFEAAAAPLRSEFDSQINSKINELSGRGVLFGDLGNKLLARTYKDQSNTLGNISQNIGVNLGKTALDQAFQANETAKTLQFQKDENLANRSLQTALSERGFEFQGSQNKLDRELSQLMADKGYAFQGSQNAADRTLQQQLQTQSLGSQADLAKLQIGAQQKSQESAQAFQTAYQNAGFVQQANMADKQIQAENNIRALDLALSGNLGGAAIQGLVDKTLGEGFVLKTESQNALEGAAAASGLSVDEFKNVRSALAKGQMQDLFTDTRKTLSYVKGEQILNPDYGRTDVNTASTNSFENVIRQAVGLPPKTTINTKDKYIAAPADITIENSNYGKPYMDAEGKQTINPDYISNPQKALDFQKQLATLYANAQLQAAQTTADAQVRAANSGSKVICTELYVQKRLPHNIWVADIEYAKQINPIVVMGYHSWGIPVTKLMRKSRFITSIVEPFAKAWAYHMAYKIGVTPNKNYGGLILEKIGIPVCYVIGSLIHAFKIGTGDFKNA